MNLGYVDVVEQLLAAPGGGSMFVKSWQPATQNRLPPVILFHDSIGCVEMWRQFPLALAARLQRRVIAYDRLGFGRSSAREQLPTVHFVAEEAEVYFPVLRSELGVKGFVAFGHSVGGGMAVMAAARFSQDCRAVITESAQAYVEQRTLNSIAAAKEKFKDPKELVKLERFHADKARWVVDAWTDTWLTAAFRDWTLKAELPKVLCPLLAIHGEFDEYGSTDFPETLSTLTAGGGEKLVLPNCGHIPHREREEAVLAGVSDFLSRTRESALSKR